MLSKDKYCLESILDSISKIQDYTSGIDNPDKLYNDIKTFDATIMNFVVIGEMVSKISDKLKTDNLNVEWNKIKDFRNILTHNYFGIDAEEVWQIIQNDLPLLKIQISKLFG
jgi:uncharacterized protein with HEPN domain